MQTARSFPSSKGALLPQADARDALGKNGIALTPEGIESLKSVVADAYKVFARHCAPTTTLDACLSCCMAPALEKQMRHMPLRKVTAKHFYEYNTAAKGEVQPVDEVLYLLPRMLELMAEKAEIHHSTELFMTRVGRCPPGSFNEAEQLVLNRFALSYFAQAISGEETWVDEPLALLLMFDIGGLDISPLLDFWHRSESPESTLHFVSATYWRFWTGQDCSNAFAGDRPGFKAKLRAWMLDPGNRRRFVDKLMQPDFLRLADRQNDWGCIPCNTMVDAAFENLTQ
jgi:hypothetical protein